MAVSMLAVLSKLADSRTSMPGGLSTPPLGRQSAVASLLHSSSLRCHRCAGDSAGSSAGLAPGGSHHAPAWRTHRPKRWVSPQGGRPGSSYCCRGGGEIGPMHAQARSTPGRVASVTATAGESSTWIGARARARARVSARARARVRTRVGVRVRVRARARVRVRRPQDARGRGGEHQRGGRQQRSERVRQHLGRSGGAEQLGRSGGGGAGGRGGLGCLRQGLRQG
eukprot:scaffold16569_cov60-Phaeocystis_antarctica.AAC.3